MYDDDLTTPVVHVHNKYIVRKVDLKFSDFGFNFGIYIQVNNYINF